MSRARDSNMPRPARLVLAEMEPGAAPADAGADRAAPCVRMDLADWTQRGGPLPARLAAHVNDCPSCAQRVRRVNQVHASLMLLRTQPAPPELTTRANVRALRFLRRAARASSAAARLLRMRPGLTRLQRAQIHAARLSLSAAAAVLILVIRAGTVMGFEQTRILGEQLAAAHWERHIDPGGEFLGPRNLA